MAETNEDPSMLISRGVGGQLASRTVALALAEMIFKSVYGEEDFKTQTPLHIFGGGDRWIIEGSRCPEAYIPLPGLPARKSAH